jgi:hypothetical protein
MNDVFIVRPFGKQSNVDFDAVDAQLIQPALQQAGLRGSTTVVIVEAGNIREDMFRLLVTADLVIADVSIHNANVFYELGIRHGLRAKRTFMLRANLDKVPFDLSTDRYLGYDAGNPGATVAALAAALRETIRSDRRDSPVYALLPDLTPPDPSVLVPLPYDFREEVERASKAQQRGDLRLLAYEARGFSWEAEGLRAVGREQFALKANPGAIETYEWLREWDPLDVEANRRLGTLYQRTGDLTRSNQAIDRVLNSPALSQRMSSEAWALRASNSKALWRAKWQGTAATPVQDKRTAALSAPDLKLAMQNYRQGFTRDLNYVYPGLNCLSLARIRLELARALPDVWVDQFDTPELAAQELSRATIEFTELAAAVKYSLTASREQSDRTSKPVDEDRIWLLISEVDFEFLSGAPAKAMLRRYSEVLQSAAPFAVDSARRQLQIFNELDICQPAAGAALEAMAALPGESPSPRKVLPHVLLFTGHMIDEPGREPRFPNNSAAEAEARRMIHGLVAREQQRAADGVVGIAGGACGGDILFHEVCAELGIETQLYLALPPHKFRPASVAQGGPAWIERFNKLCARIEPRILSDSEELPNWLHRKPDYGIWQRNNLWMLFNALAANSEDLTLIALWDKGKADGPGGTEDLVKQVESRGQRIFIAPAQRLRELR